MDGSLKPALTRTAICQQQLSESNREGASNAFPAGFVFFERPLYTTLQRTLDIAVSSVLLLACLPVLALAASAIFLEDRGPVLFVQRRVGRFERLFKMYKLRTMRADDCGDRLSPSKPGDSRITAVGRWLRITSIDELPQLWNVLRGEMTLVGPRPEMPFIVAKYEPWQHLRHLALPGITGLWQIKYRSRLPLQRPEATLIDLRYIDSSSIMTDLSILARTVGAVLGRRGAF